LQTRFALSLHDNVALRQIYNVVARRIGTTDATVTTAVTIPLANADSIVLFSVLWRGIDAAHNMVLRESTFVLRRIDTAGPTQLGSTVDLIATVKDDAGVGTPSFAISGNNALLQVTGKASTNYTWDVEATWRELF